jgi:hypothetical protein
MWIYFNSQFRKRFSAIKFIDSEFSVILEDTIKDTDFYFSLVHFLHLMAYRFRHIPLLCGVYRYK